MEQEIRQKFEYILRPGSTFEPSDFDNLAIKAFEYSVLFMEKFDAYARSIINQNKSAINEGLNKFESFSRMDRATRLLTHQLMEYWKGFVTRIFWKSVIFQRMPLRYYGTIFQKPEHLIDKLHLNLLTPISRKGNIEFNAC